MTKTGTATRISGVMAARSSNFHLTHAYVWDNPRELYTVDERYIPGHW
jgi:hypothetical protein